MSRSNLAEAAVLAREAREIGWLKAHVHVGRSYPLVAVRVSRPAARGSGIVSDTEDLSVLAVAAGAIQLARRLDGAGVALAVLEVDAAVAAGDGSGLVRVSVSGDVPPDLGEGEIARLARGDVGERLGDAVEVRVAVLGGAAEGRREPNVAAPVREEPPPTPAVAEAPTAEIAAEVPAPEAPVAEVPAPEVPAPEVPVAVAPVAEVATEVPAAEETEEAPRAEAQPPARTSRFRTGRLVWAGIAIVALGLVMLVGVRLPAQQEVLVVQQPAPTVASTAVPTVAAPLATQAPAATNTALPTATSTSVPTPTATTPPAVQAPLLDFAAGQAARPPWPSNPQGVAWFDADGYHLAARTAGQFVALGLAPGPQSDSFVVNATFHKLSGPAGGGYGLILGDSGTPPLDGTNQLGRYVVFEVGDKGEVGAWRRQEDQWVDILGWTQMPSIKSGTGENQLSVRVDGGQASFSVNGVEVPLPSRPQVSPGGLGLFLGGDGNEAVLTRLTLT